MTLTHEAPPAPGHAKSIRFWIAFAVVLIADVITKQLAVAHLSPRYVPHDIVGDFVRFTLAYNPGAAFGMHLGAASRYAFGLFTVFILVVLARFYRATPSTERLRIIALGLVCGGAVGNLLDRIRSPLGVVDFIDIGTSSWRFWTFNVADSGVTIGALLLAIVLWREEQREARAARPSAGTTGGAGATE
jgi:signal peptidase II